MTVVHAHEDDPFSAALCCHNANGKNYMAAFTQDRVTISSYEDDTIWTTVSTWVDTVPALA